MKQLSIVIVNFNTQDVLQECLANLQDSYPNLQIIVVDAGSSDDSVKLVRNQFKNVLLIIGEDKGLATNTNLGLQQATGDYILHLGSDAFPSKKDLIGLVDYMEKNPDVGIATAKLVTRDGNLDMDAHRGFPTPWAAFTHFIHLNYLFPRSKFFNSYFLGGEDLTKTHEIDLCISHFMLVRKKVYDQGFAWDEDYFLFGEDVEFCFQVKKAGWKIMYVPEFVVMHIKGTGVGRKTSRDLTNLSRTSPRIKSRVRKESVRAMQLFYNKNYADKYPKIVTSAVLTSIRILGFVRTKIKKNL